MIARAGDHTETTGQSRPSILPKLSLCLSLASFLMSGAALSIAVNPEGARELAARVAAWASEAQPNPDAAAAQARLGRRKAAYFAGLKSRALEASKRAQPPQPPQPADGTAGR